MADKWDEMAVQVAVCGIHPKACEGPCIYCRLSLGLDQCDGGDSCAGPVCAWCASLAEKDSALAAFGKECTSLEDDREYNAKLVEEKDAEITRLSEPMACGHTGRYMAVIPAPDHSRTADTVVVCVLCEIARLRAALDKVPEWISIPQYNIAPCLSITVCPVCQRPKAEGHAPDCVKVHKEEK